MGHYDAQRGAYYEEQRTAQKKRIATEAAQRDVPLVKLEYDVVAMCDNCGGKIYRERHFNTVVLCRCPP